MFKIGSFVYIFVSESISVIGQIIKIDYKKEQVLVNDSFVTYSVSFDCVDPV